MVGEEGPITRGVAGEGAAEGVSWAALLAHWVEFAKAGRAFPTDRQGRRARATVAPAIGLQAVTFALGDLRRLAQADVSPALDRAEVLIERHERELQSAWRGEAMPGEVAALISDARTALAGARRGTGGGA